MSSVTLKIEGDFAKTTAMMASLAKGKNYRRVLEKYGKQGVEALRSATPKDSGLTAESWFYEVKNESRGIWSLEWGNTNVQKGYFNVALMLQLGHGTRNGGYVKGRDYINPAILPIFEEMLGDILEEVMAI